MVNKVEKVNHPPAIRGIDLHIPERPRLAAVGSAFVLDTAKNRVEFRVAHMKRIVMHAKILPAIIEVHSKTFIYPHRSERTHRPVITQPEKLREVLSRRHLVARRNDSVIQYNCHTPAPMMPLSSYGKGLGIFPQTPIRQSASLLRF